VSDIAAIAARHAEDEAGGPFVGRRSEQARLDRGTLLEEVARLRKERDSLLELQLRGVACRPSEGPEAT
jgi:hypothetical protein